MGGIWWCHLIANEEGGNEEVCFLAAQGQMWRDHVCGEESLLGCDGMLGQGGTCVSLRLAHQF